jgi:N utilization substance protein B
MCCPLVYDSRNEKDENAYSFARNLAVETFKHIDDVEPMIRKHLQNWDFDRVALMDILLINMAVTEFTSCPSIPERVTVDEYIELSKEFSTEKSKLFINGILDKILIELRVAGRINKDERGLYDPDIDGPNPPDEN